MEQEQPIYVLKQSKKRALIPKILIRIILAVIFYFGVLLNLSFLELRAGQETSVKTISLVILIIVVLVGIFLSVRTARRPYLFYRDRIMFGKKSILYTDITNTLPHKNPVDRIFRTSSVHLNKNPNQGIFNVYSGSNSTASSGVLDPSQTNKKFILRNIPKDIQIQNYLEQLAAYSRKVNPH